MSTPQVRSRELLTERGFLVGTVESTKKFPARDKKAPKPPCRACGHQQMVEISVDLWNVFDLIALHPETSEKVFVQVTAGTHHSDRKNKILASMEAKLVLLSGAKILIQTWNKDEKENRWKVREEEITLKDFAQAFAYPNTVRELQEIRRKERKDDFPPGTTLPLSPDLGQEAF